MSCGDALVKKVLTLRPEQGVEEALDLLNKGGAPFAPVLDGEGIAVGLFSLGRLLESALPVSVTVGDHLGSVNLSLPNAPGMGKRLRRYMAGRVADVMQRPFRAVNPDTPLETAIRFIREGGEPLAVVESDTGKFVGIVTDGSVLAALQRMDA